MLTEIKKTKWVRFCKEFNLANQYRRADVRIEYEPTGSVEIMESSMFLGLALSKKRRWIEEITLICGNRNLDDVIGPVASVYQPAAIHATEDESGTTVNLMIVGKDGTTISISLAGEQDPDFCHGLKEILAHSVYERRGSNHGADVNDWLEAENAIREAGGSLA